MLFIGPMGVIQAPIEDVARNPQVVTGVYLEVILYYPSRSRINYSRWKTQQKLWVLQASYKLWRHYLPRIISFLRNQAFATIGNIWLGERNPGYSWFVHFVAGPIPPPINYTIIAAAVTILGITAGSTKFRIVRRRLPATSNQTEGPRNHPASETA